MEPTFTYTTTDKAVRYEQFLQDFLPYIADEYEEVSVLANTTAALRQAFGWFWIGFYLVQEDHLILGPFQGDVACYRIAKGRGVCGTSWAKACSQVVPDVENFPGHIACSSASRSEIVAATKELARKVKAGEIQAEDIDDKMISASLYTAEMPDPDLIIRTSGEYRLSNFLMWQASYAEFYFTDVLWPDFDKEELEKAVEDFSARDRRYGLVK